MLGTLLIIDLADVNSIVLGRPVAVRDLATRIVCRGERLRASIIDDEERLFAVQVLIDLVVDEWRPQRNLLAYIAGL